MRRKLFYTLLTLIFSINLLHSQAVKHAEFLGIQINGSLESFTLQLENKGFTKKHIFKNSAYYHGKFTDQYIDLYIQSESSKVYAVSVIFKEKDGWVPLVREYDLYKSKLIEKYGEPNEVEEKFEYPYENSSGLSLSAIKEGKCHFRNVFINENATGMIALEINETAQVIIRYIDIKNYHEISKDVFDDL